ncbi:hypothetical protein O181_075026 [Austropuccinia psidii MF-1]|uniref:Uncharacterized protein n=1 Tax=Austropuccinia psidii MF-1 TaxID=1389203 RepID=A0A9Q3FDW7_9BASI|nr:hypothetical protein [Austropuccinia psidii MF-1]
MEAKEQEWEFLPSFWIGTINPYLQVKKLMGPEKTQELMKGWKPMSCKGQVQKIKTCLKNQSLLSKDQKKELSQKKDNRTVEAPKASKSKNLPQKAPNISKKAPKNNQKGKQKAKYKWNKPYCQNYRISMKEKTAMDNVFNILKNLMEFKNKEEERMNQSFPKK